MVRKIFEKYDYDLPSMEYQTMNRYIKDVAKDAGLDDIVTFQRTERGKEKIYALPRYRLVTTHTMRKSFDTNMYKMGLPMKVIIDITRHKKEDTFMS